MAPRNSLNALRGALILTLLLGIAACTGESDSDTSSLGSPKAVVENRVTGSVGDGPIVGARIRVRAKSGSLLEEFNSSSTADYDVVVKTQGRNYALTIEADQGIDLVTGGPPDFRLVSGIIRPNERSISNLNPYTTLIFGAAQHNGGISDSSVASARDAVVNRYGFGLDKHLIADPTSTKIDETNVHVIVKTSETLGEMVRRTRDALPNLDGDAVMAALSADLSDGWIDGRGARGNDARIAAVANVASGAVLVQAMANRLHVYGTNATSAMDNAIRQVRPNAGSSITTANVSIPAEAFDQAVRSLRAAEVLVNDERIAQTIAVMQSAVPGARPADIAAQLPSGIDTLLDDAVRRTAAASDSQIAEVNIVASTEGGSSDDGGGSGGGDDGSGNQPPAISGTPDTALVVGTPWSFQPTASDPDGDGLTFSIQGQPAWASFDTSTGRLSGTPNAAGSYGPITITVSDGQAHDSLAPFTLQVAEPSLGSATVSWTPPTQRTDGSALTNLAGYKVFYGKNSSSFTHIVDVKNAGQTSHFVENLDSGTWYFAVSAYDSEGLESAKSATASKTIS
jgi:hypothetical protein